MNMSNEDRTALVGSLQKFSVEDGPGIRTTVFFKGCPLNCKWCHNPEMIDPAQQLIQIKNNCIGCGYCLKVCPNGAIIASPEDGMVIDRDKCKVCLKCAGECYAKALRPVANPMTIDEIMDVVEQDKGFYDNTGGGMTISGGEVLMQSDFMDDLIDEAAERGINVCIDTCGFGDGDKLLAMALKKNVAHILYDMKSIDDDVHRECTGVSNKLIIANLELLANDEQIRDKIIMRMPLVAGLNDGDDIIKETGQLYKRLGLKTVNLLPYHNLGISKQRNVGGEQEQFKAPSEERMNEILSYFKDEIGMECIVQGET